MLLLELFPFSSSFYVFERSTQKHCTKTVPGTILDTTGERSLVASRETAPKEAANWLSLVLYGVAPAAATGPRGVIGDNRSGCYGPAFSGSPLLLPISTKLAIDASKWTPWWFLTPATEALLWRHQISPVLLEVSRGGGKWLAVAHCWPLYHGASSCDGAHGLQPPQLWQRRHGKKCWRSGRTSPKGISGLCGSEPGRSGNSLVSVTRKGWMTDRTDMRWWPGLFDDVIDAALHLRFCQVPSVNVTLAVNVRKP